MNKSEEMNSKSEEKIKKEELNRYNNSKVYKLINTVDDTFYIGSTCTSLSKRLNKHKTVAKRDVCKDTRLYSHLNKIGVENVKIILINEFYLDNKEQLLREENNYIEMYKNDTNCLNSIRAYRSKDLNREYDRIRNKTENRKEMKKRIYEKNKETILEKCKEYRENNKEKIKERKQKTYSCICGSENITFEHKSRHERSKKHQNFIHDLNEESQTI